MLTATACNNYEGVILLSGKTNYTKYLPHILFVYYPLYQHIIYGDEPPYTDRFWGDTIIVAFTNLILCFIGKLREFDSPMQEMVRKQEHHKRANRRGVTYLLK